MKFLLCVICLYLIAFSTSMLSELESLSNQLNQDISDLKEISHSDQELENKKKMSMIINKENLENLMEIGAIPDSFCNIMFGQDEEENDIEWEGLFSNILVL